MRFGLSHKWYVNNESNGQLVGPYTEQQIIDMFSKGLLRDDDLVCRDDSPSLMTFAQAREQFGITSTSAEFHSLNTPHSIERLEVVISSTEIEVDNALVKDTSPKSNKSSKSGLFFFLLLLLGVGIGVYLLSIRPYLLSQEAIHLVRKSKVVPGASALFGKIFNMTNDDAMKIVAERNAKKGIKLKWTSNATKEDSTYLVGFVRVDNERGRFWEADLKNKMVRSISGNEFLRLKYGITDLRLNGDFVVQNEKKTQFIVRRSRVYFKITSSVKNNTGKQITKAKLSAKLYIIFNVNKILELESTYSSRFYKRVSSYRPWKNNQVKRFIIKTKSFKKIYTRYKPKHVYIKLYLNASDPIGYEFNSGIEKIHLNWNFDRK